MKESLLLGISCFYHDSAAALVCNGEIIAAAQEERFTRKKHDSGFPSNSIKYCLSSKSIDLTDLDAVIYYEKPLLTFERLLETYLATAPRGSRSFITSMQVWMKKKLFLKSEIINKLKSIQKECSSEREHLLPELLFSEHHLSHASAAFYPSPFEEAAVICMDGVGEWATTSAWIGRGRTIKPLWEICFPHSLGLLYSAFTYYCGFKVNSGEYKLMGLAPYGEPSYVDLIKDNIIDIKSDGTFRLNMSYFKYHRGFRMTSRKFHKLFGEAPRERESKLTKFHMDLASSIQLITEEIVSKLAVTVKRETGMKNLCLAGGVALNCVANGKLIRKNIFDDIWIQPASGDAGSSIGAALSAYYQYFKNDRVVNSEDSMKGSYLGPIFSNREIEEFLLKVKASFSFLDDKELFIKVAELIDSGNVVGWFNGPMEFGPRALGGRSILGDPRNKKMQSIMNLKIKYRESFRPFAPSILEDDLSSQFETTTKSPYMLIVSPVKKELCCPIEKSDEQLIGLEKLKSIRSSLPAITHVDYSARVQTVSERTNPRYFKLIRSFKERTGCPSIINTSFNVRGEPIVCTPEDAYKCFMRTEMDILVLENYVLLKKNQPKISDDLEWMNEFELD